MSSVEIIILFYVLQIKNAYSTPYVSKQSNSEIFNLTFNGHKWAPSASSYWAYTLPFNCICQSGIERTRLVVELVISADAYSRIKLFLKDFFIFFFPTVAKEYELTSVVLFVISAKQLYSICSLQQLL